MNSQNPNAVQGKSPLSDSAKKASREEPEHTGMAPSDSAKKVGSMQTDGQAPSVISSAGGIGKQFNADGSIGSIGQAIGGPFAKHGAIGSQFDAAQGGIAGGVEKLVGGPKAEANQ